MRQAKKAVKKDKKKHDASGMKRSPDRRNPSVRRIALWTAGALLCLFTAGQMSMALEQSPEFTLKEVRVEGCKRIDPESIWKLCELRRGMNLVSLNAGKVSEDLEKHPPVRSATVVKQFPHTLLIRIQERSPALLVKFKGELCYMDAQGVVFSEVHPGEPLDLPVVTGLEGYRWSKGLRQEGRVIQTCLDLLGELNRSETLGPLSEIHVHPSEGLRFFLEAYPVPIRIGWEGFHDRRVRLEKVLPFLLGQGHELASVDLRFARRVTVKQSDRMRGRITRLKPWKRAGEGMEKSDKERRHPEDTQDA